jgi:hypothetical protein
MRLTTGPMRSSSTGFVGILDVIMGVGSTLVGAGVGRAAVGGGGGGATGAMGAAAGSSPHEGVLVLTGLGAEGIAGGGAGFLIVDSSSLTGV